MHVLMGKLLLTVFLAGIGGLLLRELIQWIERRATRAMRARRQARANESQRVASNKAGLADVPRCPSCRGAMILRRARRGSRAGKEFWGCLDFPKCRGTRPI